MWPEIITQIRRRLARQPPAPAVAPAADAARPKPFHWYSPSSLVLIATNLVPLYGVLVLGWPVFPIMVLYWLENVVIGILNALRMLLVAPAEAALWPAKLLQVPVFCLHYGLFAGVHGLLIFGLFGSPVYEPLIHHLWTGDAVRHAIVEHRLGISLAALAASHGFSFLWNYLLSGEFRNATLNGLMARPYGRVIVLHVTILAGGCAAMILGSPLWALILLVGLKIALDLRAHLREHGTRAPASPASSGPG